MQNTVLWTIAGLCVGYAVRSRVEVYRVRKENEALNELMRTGGKVSDEEMYGPNFMDEDPNGEVRAYNFPPSKLPPRKL